jgi:hypothetical protein
MSPEAIPRVLNDYLPAAEVSAMLIVAAVIFRLVAKTVIRFILLAVLAAVAVFLYLNQAPLRTCARTCACEFADTEITVPACATDEG